MISSSPEGTPLVSVLLPCYNAEKFLAATLDSICAQTYSRLDIVAIDDGSKDSTGRILADYARRDSRIRLLPNDRNRGLIYTLNRGVSLADGPLLARMDADDVAVPHRIAKQVEHLVRHAETQVLSSDVSYIREDGSLLYDPVPFRFNAVVLRFLLFFLNPICHPTITARTDVLRRFPYADQAVHSEDFELWHRMLRQGVVFRNVPERLLRFRPNLGSVSSRNEEQQSNTFLRISAEAIRDYFGFDVATGAHRILTARMSSGAVRGADLLEALDLFDHMRADYARREKLDRQDLAMVNSFSGRHLAGVLHQAYRRSSDEDSARSLAMKRAAALALCNPMPFVRIAGDRLRARSRRG